YDSSGTIKQVISADTLKNLGYDEGIHRLSFSYSKTGDLSIYTDGKKVSSVINGEGTGILSEIMERFLLGANGWDSPSFLLNSAIEDVYYNSTCLTDAEIQAGKDTIIQKGVIGFAFKNNLKGYKGV
ncbi:MAG: hypothetical protein K8E24_013170, partial [Methanobacterium paludis]|nr:hypothetical protein [Methanobacterium paludis]